MDVAGHSQQAVIVNRMYVRMEAISCHLIENRIICTEGKAKYALSLGAILNLRGE
jgi:hypothetical protein